MSETETFEKAKRDSAPKKVEQASEENDALDQAGDSYFTRRKKFARESGDTRYATLLGQQDRVVQDLAFGNTNSALSPNENRLVAGAMADALDVFAADTVVYQEGSEAVVEAENLFRELGNELFGEASTSTEAAATKLISVGKKFERLKGTHLEHISHLFDTDMELLAESGSASRQAKEDPFTLKQHLERLQHLLASSVANSMGTIEEMRMDREMPVTEANEKSKDVLRALAALHQLQGLIDGLGARVEKTMAKKEQDASVRDASATAHEIATRVEGGEVKVEILEHQRQAQKIDGLIDELLVEDEQGVERSAQRGANYGRRFAQFIDVFAKLHPGVSRGEAYRRIAEDIRARKRDHMTRIPKEKAHSAQYISLKFAIDDIFATISESNPNVAKAIEQARKDEEARQRAMGKGGTTAIFNSSADNFLRTIYMKIVQQEMI